MPRISLCGANSGGKTTLATELHKILGPGFSLLTYSRPTAAARKMGYDSARYVPNDDQTQWNFQCLGLFEQIRAQEQLKDNFISDRSVYDFLAYTNNKMPWLMHSAQHQVYEQMTMEFGDYDFLFFVSNPNDFVPDNGIRLLSPPKPVEDELRRILDNNSVPYHHVRATTLETRIDEVLKVLGI